MLTALRHGFSGLARNWGLVLVVLVVNLGLALLLAIPLAGELDRDLAHTGASSRMLYGFDYDWWSAWSEDQDGLARSFRPDAFGIGFAFKNLDQLLRGRLPMGLFPEAGRAARLRSGSRSQPPPLGPLILGVAALSLLAQVFLTGGLLGVLRAPQGGWTFRALVHGAGFYCGRLLRVSVLALALAWVVFALNVPFARWVDGVAREAVSGRTALLLGLGRHALLFIALLAVHAVASFARVIVVREERQSAALAVLSSMGFCARNALAIAGQYALIITGAVLLLALWAGFDARFAVIGWKSQLVALVVFEALLAGRIALRLGLLGSQLALHAARAGKGRLDRV
jgi:hypothetical protein